ncbi:MAG: hypothetical protein HUU35_10855 [Armatimonadetes bacterium]|nr:hypothetical protein [Armatimonadota bacterium]
MAVRVGAHRGAMCYAPENTLAAFQRALELGTYRIELDVRRTRDGVLVLLHDETVDRTTNGSGRLADLTWAEVKELRAGDQPLPTLAQTLEFARDRTRLLVEVKDYQAVDDIVTAIRTAGLTDRCTISCFDEGVLARVKQTSAIATAWFHVQPGPLHPAELVERLGVELLVVWPAAATPEVMAAAQAAGLTIRCGFPDHLTYEETAAGIRRLVDLGATELACGRPDWIRDALASLGVLAAN